MADPLHIGDLGPRRLGDRGPTTGFTTSLISAPRPGRAWIAHDLARREDLVRDFIIAASKTYGDAIGNNEPKMPEIVDLYARVNRMHVLGMRKTTPCADVFTRASRFTSRMGSAFHASNLLAIPLKRLVSEPQALGPAMS